MKNNTDRKTLTRPIYDKNFYLAQAIINSKKFAVQKQILKDKLQKMGKPISDNGFSVEEYFKWTREGNVLTHHHSLVDDLIRSFGITNIDEELHNSIFVNIFFNIKKAPQKPTHGTGIELEPEKGRGILKLIIFPWTIGKDVEEDVKKLVKEIKELLKSTYKKNKEWENFDRDIKIYEIYQKVSQEQKPKKITYKDIKDNDKYQKILDRYGHINNNEFGQILLRCRRTFNKASFI